jgi:UDP-N-acetylglucosamine pyrophosphorylase
LCDGLKEQGKKYGVTIPWFIMTSKENNDETLEFLETNDFFGYDKSEVMLFSQGELPLVDTEGKMLVR